MILHTSKGVLRLKHAYLVWIIGMVLLASVYLIWHEHPAKLLALSYGVTKSE